MKIVVLSDTHSDSMDSLPKRLVDELSGADLIIHSGDFTEKRMLDDLRKLRNFRGVCGNLDAREIKNELPATDILEANAFRIGITHPVEGGPPLGLEERVRPKFGDVDAIVFGHSHRAVSERRGKILYLNPGSATGTPPASKKTFAILTIDDEVRARIVTL